MKINNGQINSKEFKFYRSITFGVVLFAMCSFFSIANATTALNSWTTDGGNLVIPRTSGTDITSENINIGFNDEEVLYLEFAAPANDLTIRTGIFNLNRTGLTPTISKLGFRFENVDPANAPNNTSFLNRLRIEGLAAGTAPPITVESRESGSDYLQLWFAIGGSGFVENSAELAFTGFHWNGFELADKQQQAFNLNIGINNSSLDLTSEEDVSNIPVPAAIWFFGTGLAGLLFSRRKNG